MPIRWDPLKDIMNLQDRMQRVFQDGFQTADKGQWQPPVDIYENDEEIVILAEIPGVNEENIDIQINDGLLLIHGEKQSPMERSSDSYYRLERPFGKFARSFAIPTNVDADNVSAKLKDGVLCVTLKKLLKKENQSIKITRD